MESSSQNNTVCATQPFDISDDDVLEAMKAIPGYLDITPGDFKVLYQKAFRLAIERLSGSVKARDMMTTPVVTAEKNTPSEEVARMMAQHNITGVPVVDKKRVVGIITEKDFLFHLGNKSKTSFMDIIAHCLENKGCLAISMRRQKAEDLMSSPAITVYEDLPVAELADILTEKRINRVPVTDREGRLLGIVARTDIVQASCPPL